MLAMQKAQVHARNAEVVRSLGHDAVLLRVLSPFERDPGPLDGLTLEDEETGELVDLPATGAREAYAAAFAAHTRELEEGASALGVALLSIDTDTPFDDVVLRALRAGVFSARSVS